MSQVRIAMPDAGVFHVAPEGRSTYAARPSIPMAATIMSETMALSALHFTERRHPIAQGAELLVRAFGKISPGM